MAYSLKKITASMLAVISLTVGSQALAKNNPPPTIKADAPNRYVVKKGDTLWDISGKFLDKPWRWKEIWATNQQIKNPHLIYPNDVLILCVIRGQTLVGIDTGEGCAGVEKAMTAPAQAVQNLAGSIPAIPLASIEAWLDRTIIVSPDDYRTTPYVLASKTKNIITGAGNKIYTKGVPLIVGQRYGVYREGEPYIDPISKKVIGLEVTQVASGVVTDVASNGVSSIELQKSFGQEVREGDRVFVEVGNYLPPAFYPRPANATRGGRVIRVLNSISSTGRDGVVAINLGSRENVEAGDVLTVFQKGALVQDNFSTTKGEAVRLPSEEIGHVMVFKTFDNISYAYVLDAELPINEADYLANPQN
ncbi:LysM peptidoglycan-binding domain-containing protein [Faucicola mancuniensis]|uniref:LysM peptidoglycan-binding domain-containing protein n=1 Tax=Faucicola mancuniensis TaxID=1309795 RepID=UPI0028E20497|nr:LysM peptidoglycan-binding domain-containing protein [uncultured Moraxella sp.]